MTRRVRGADRRSHAITVCDIQTPRICLVAVDDLPHPRRPVAGTRRHGRYLLIGISRIPACPPRHKGRFSERRLSIPILRNQIFLFLCRIFGNRILRYGRLLFCRRCIRFFSVRLLPLCGQHFSSLVRLVRLSGHGVFSLTRRLRLSGRGIYSLVGLLPLSGCLRAALLRLFFPVGILLLSGCLLFRECRLVPFFRLFRFRSSLLTDVGIFPGHCLFAFRRQPLYDRLRRTNRSQRPLSPQQRRQQNRQRSFPLLFISHSLHPQHAFLFFFLFFLPLPDHNSPQSCV